MRIPWKHLVVLALSMSGLAACSLDGLRQSTYNTLRQLNCEREMTQPEYENCARSYDQEFRDYDYQRRMNTLGSDDDEIETF